MAAPKPRTPKVGFTKVPKKWLADSTVASQIANGVNLLFPAGERFFVRSVKHYLDQIEDPALRADVKGFFGQEGRHAQAHERYFDTMRAHGYDIDRILDPYERLAYGIIEKASPPALRLACTAACEHFTAILADDALREDVLEYADPEMRRLLSWHAIEELEHKAVAFDVLVATNPSYVLRVAGLFLAATLLGGFWLFATRDLLAQDGLSLRDAIRGLGKLRDEGQRRGGHVPKPILSRVFGRGIREYLRPGFHPSDEDHRAVIDKTLARLAAEGVIEPDDIAVAAE